VACQGSRQRAANLPRTYPASLLGRPARRSRRNPPAPRHPRHQQGTRLLPPSRRHEAAGSRTTAVVHERGREHRHQPSSRHRLLPTGRGDHRTPGRTARSLPAPRRLGQSNDAPNCPRRPRPSAALHQHRNLPPIRIPRTIPKTRPRESGSPDNAPQQPTRISPALFAALYQEGRIP
jgi:hypothetical protein